MGTLFHTERPLPAGRISAMQTYSPHTTHVESHWDRSGVLAGLDEAQYTSRRLDGHATYPSDRRRSTHGRLHKRVGSGSSDPRRRPAAIATPDLVSEGSDPILPSPHPTPEDTLGSIQKSPASYKPRSDNLRKNLRWLTQPATRSASPDLKDEIDLSRTAAENEERSGLGIAIPPSRLVESPILSDDTYGSASPAITRSHARTLSHNSASSQNMSTSFKPTVPFVHPIHQSPRPGMPTSHSNSFNSERSSDAVTRPRGESVTSAFPSITRNRGESSASTFTARTFDTSEASTQRPILKLNTSNSSSTRASASATPIARSRRGTNMSNMSRPEYSSPDIISPSSRTSLDRAFSFMRRDTDPVDPAVRAASIHAARQAFQDREEAKVAKQERQERRAAERREQAALKVEERKRRKSDATEKKHTVEAEKQRRKSDAASKAERAHERSGGIFSEKVAQQDFEIQRKIPGRRESAPRRPKPAVVSGGRVKGADATHSAVEDVKFPRVSRKRAAKSIYLRFWTWFKTRLLRIDQARR